MPFTLTSLTDNGTPLEATFLPEKGMNMASFKLGDIEAIDQSTRSQFEKTFAGLGALIGPHFHRRKPHLIPKNIDEKTFPHAAYFKDDPLPDPFTHGVGRYAPWNVEFSDHSFQAKLSGDDVWNEVRLADIEGQNFKMFFKGVLKNEGLELELSVVSEIDSIVGIHYYYHLPNGKGTVFSQVQDTYIVNNERKPIPPDWQIDSQNRLTYPLDRDTDYTLHPYPDPLNGKILLDTETHRLITTYQSDSEESAWQLWHPKGASFVCIEPVSSQDPRHPNLTVSSIRIQLKLEAK